mgnify:CR=1 FL=1
MKHTIRLLFLLTGLTVAVSPGLQAQTDGQLRSRLELGRKPAVSNRLPGTRNFPFLQQPATASLDRAFMVPKNAVINQYYRSAMLMPSVAKTTPRPATPETLSTVATDNRPLGGEEIRKIEDRMYTSDKIVVSNAYPNPASEFADVDYHITGPIGEAKLILFNVLGAPVAEYTLDRSERKARIVTRDWNSGYYLYMLSLDGRKVATKKLLVKHQ